MMSGKTILAALLLLTALFSGCAGEEQVYEGKTYAIEAEKIQGILIDVRDRRIEVSASEDDRIYIDYFESEENGYDIQVSVEGLLSITGRKEEGFSGYFKIIEPQHQLAVATLQGVLDEYTEYNKKCRLDFIHGEDVVTSLGKKRGNIGFYLPAIQKSELFSTVVLDGALPRKTFSMGRANEKR